MMKEMAMSVIPRPFSTGCILVSVAEMRKRFRINVEVDYFFHICQEFRSICRIIATGGNVHCCFFFLCLGGSYQAFNSTAFEKIHILLLNKSHF